MGGIWEDAVDAFGVEGGEGCVPEALDLDDAVGGDVGFEQFEETDLVGVESWVLLDEGFEVVVDLFRVEADDSADGEGEVLGFVRIVVKEFFEVKVRILEQNVLDELIAVLCSKRSRKTDSTRLR